MAAPPQTLEQVIERAEAVLKPEHAALNDADLIRFLNEEIGHLETARTARKEAERQKKAADLLSQLVTKKSEAIKAANTAATDAETALRNYLIAVGQIPAPQPTP